jgi:hypothetical protein
MSESPTTTIPNGSSASRQPTGHVNLGGRVPGDGELDPEPPLDLGREPADRCEGVLGHLALGAADRHRDDDTRVGPTVGRGDGGRDDPGRRPDHPLDLGDDTERVGRRDDVEGDDERCVGARSEGPRDGVEGLPLG